MDTKDYETLEKLFCKYGITTLKAAIRELYEDEIKGKYLL